MRGYIYPTRFARASEPPPEAGHLTVAIDGLTPGIFRVEFFETATGTAVRRFDVRTQDSVLSIPVPHFRSDFAFKAYLLTPVAKRAF